MDMYKVKWTQLQSEIFRFLCINAGKELSLRNIAKQLKKSPTAVSNALKGLVKEELVKIKKSESMNLLSIEFNRDSQNAINMKRVENLKLIYESGLVKLLQDSFPGGCIILFGSYSRGDDVWTNKIEEHRSDIDIAVIGYKEKQLNLSEFDKKLERNIIINFYSSFAEIHKHLRDSILNGILLSGSVDL